MNGKLATVSDELVVVFDEFAVASVEGHYEQVLEVGFQVALPDVRKKQLFAVSSDSDVDSVQVEFDQLQILTL